MIHSGNWILYFTPFAISSTDSSSLLNMFTGKLIRLLILFQTLDALLEGVAFFAIADLLAVTRGLLYLDKMGTPSIH